MNSSGLLQLSYLSMYPALNFSGQTTYLSGAARAQKPHLPDGVMSLAGDHCGLVGGLALRCLRLSMTLRRSSWPQPYSRSRRFCVIRRCALLSANRWLPLVDGTASIWARFARSCDRLPTEGSSRGLPVDRLTMI
jgi:hypothetical protein